MLVTVEHVQPWPGAGTDAEAAEWIGCGSDESEDREARAVTAGEKAYRGEWWHQEGLQEAAWVRECDMFGLLPVNVLPLCRYRTTDRFDFVHLMSIESVPQRQRARRFRCWWSGAVAPCCFSTRFCAATTSGQQQFEDSNFFFVNGFKKMTWPLLGLHHSKQHSFSLLAGISCLIFIARCS